MPIRRIALAVFIAGTLDLIAAFWFAGQAGASPTRVLQFVASGPFGDAMMRDTAYAPLGALVHYAIMTAMVLAYFAVAPRFAWTRAHPIMAGLAYGLVLWLVMYGVVQPLRWENRTLPRDWHAIAQQWFCHLVLVGLPIAWLARGPRVTRPARS